MSPLPFTLLWNVGLATALAVLVGVACKWRVLQHRPALAHTLWLLVLAKLITPPLIPLPVLSTVRADLVIEHAQLAPIGANDAMRLSLPSDASGVEANLAAPSTIQADEVTPKPGRSTLWLAILIGASGCGTLILVAGCLSQLVRVSRILRVAPACNERLTGLVQASAARMGLRRAPVVRAVNASIGPFLWIRCSGPVIVLPTDLADRMNDEQISCIFCHELAHYARRDHWANLFAFMVTSLFWWHPVAWWARREIRAAQEVCCDGLVLASEVANRRCYAETLFQTLEFIQAVKPLCPALATGFGNSSSLKRRFEMIANRKVNPRFSWCAATIVVSCTAAMLCVPVRGQSEAARADIGLFGLTNDAADQETADPTQVTTNKLPSETQAKTDDDPAKLIKEIEQLRVELAQTRLDLAKAHYASAIHQAQSDFAKSSAINQAQKDFAKASAINQAQSDFARAKAEEERASSLSKVFSRNEPPPQSKDLGSNLSYHLWRNKRPEKPAPRGPMSDGNDVDLSSGRTAAVSPDKRRIAVARENVVDMVDITTDKLLFRSNHHVESVHSLAFSPDGKTLASGSFGVLLQDATTGKPTGELLTQYSVVSICFSDDGNKLIVELRDGNTLIVEVRACELRKLDAMTRWNPMTGELLRQDNDAAPPSIIHNK